MSTFCCCIISWAQSTVRYPAKPVPNRARGVNQLLPNKIWCQLRCPWVSETHAQAGRFVTGYMEDPWFPRRRVVADVVDSRASQTAWHVWTIGLYSQYFSQRGNVISQHTLSCTMEFIFLFLYSNLFFPARGVSAGSICISIILPGVCKIFTLSLLSCHFATEFFFSFLHQLTGDLPGRRRGSRKKSNFVHGWYKLPDEEICILELQ